jgi:hypothetical protein
MNKLKLTVFLISFLISQSANATLISFELEGTVSSVHISPDLSDFGISPGDAFHATMTYDLAIKNFGGLYFGMRQPVPFLSLIIGSQEFITGAENSINIFVEDGLAPTPSRPDIFSAEYPDGFGLTHTPWDAQLSNQPGGFLLALLDYSGAAVSSDSMPTQFNIADWPDGHSIEFYTPPTGGNNFYDLRLDITSIISVADQTGTGSLLAIVLLPILVLMRRTRQ